LRKTIILITHDVDEAILLSDRVYVLTARPGRLRMVMDVALPRPRNYHSVTTGEFNRLKATMLAALHEESSRPAWNQRERPVE
jgi:ABC-type nitrate/sulfonate/bicarbonate transport system ATPase subunit